MARTPDARSAGIRRWLPAALPLAAALAIGVLVITLFPGPSPPSATVTATPLPSPSATPAANAATQRPTPVATPHPSARTRMAWAHAEGVLYLAGGMIDGRRTTSVVAFDGTRWRTLPSLPEPRLGAALGAFDDGTLVLAGGEAGGELLDETLVLLPGAQRWTAGPSLPYPLAFAAYAVASERLYLFGGTQRGASNAVLSLDPLADAWSSHAAMPAAASHASAVPHEGIIYVTGGVGDDGQPRVEAAAYDVADDSWTPLPDAPIAMSGHASAVADGWLWLIGERTFVDARFGEIPVYELATDRWTFVDAYAPAGSEQGLAAVSLPNGDIMVVGGSGAVEMLRGPPQSPP